MAKNQKRRRENLMKSDPHCHWCGKEVVYFPMKRCQKMPKNYATLDHITSRFKEGVRPMVRCATVLACFECNVKRSDQELGENKMKQRLKSGRLPLKMKWLSPFVPLLKLLYRVR